MAIDDAELFLFRARLDRYNVVAGALFKALRRRSIGFFANILFDIIIAHRRITANHMSICTWCRNGRVADVH